MRMTDRRFAALLLLPAVAFLVPFVAWPILRLVINSFYKISPIAGGPRSFIGFANYVNIWSSGSFLPATARTLAYTTLVVTLEFLFGFAVALLFSALGRRSSVFRTIFMYPLMIAPVVAGLLWRFLLIDNFGIVNEILFRLGVLKDTASIGWLSDPKIALFAVAIPDIWLTTAFMALVLYAGLQNLPGDVLEAARIDGAGTWSMLTRVVVPLMRPVIAVVLVIRGVDAAKAFDIIQIQTGGGPQNATQTLSLLIYRTMVRFGEPGQASAMGTLFLLVMLAVATLAVFMIWRPGGQR